MWEARIIESFCNRNRSGGCACHDEKRASARLVAERRQFDHAPLYVSLHARRPDDGPPTMRRHIRTLHRAPSHAACVALDSRGEYRGCAFLATGRRRSLAGCSSACYSPRGVAVSHLRRLFATLTSHTTPPPREAHRWATRRPLVGLHGPVRPRTVGQFHPFGFAITLKDTGRSAAGPAPEAARVADLPRLDARAGGLRLLSLRDWSRTSASSIDPEHPRRPHARRSPAKPGADDASTIKDRGWQRKPARSGLSTLKIQAKAMTRRCAPRRFACVDDANVAPAARRPDQHFRANNIRNIPGRADRTYPSDVQDDRPRLSPGG